MYRHIETLAPYAWFAAFPPKAPEPAFWHTKVEDPDKGEINLTGELRDPGGARDLYVLVHGLGGGTDSIYCKRGAAAVAAIGQASLCLALRGADRLGEDFYNIALKADLEATMRSPRLAYFERIFLIGYSMGGYVTMHYARNPNDERVKAAAAICTPIDLKDAQLHIDSLSAWIYRKHVLKGLIEIYQNVAKRKPVPNDPALVAKVRTMHDWDRLTIAPRYGYDSPEHYYEALNIRPHLGSLKIPVLHVASRRDPVIAPRTIEPFLDAAAAPYELHWADAGGHVNWSRRLDLGLGGTPGLEGQLFSWFERQA